MVTRCIKCEQMKLRGRQFQDEIDSLRVAIIRLSNELNSRQKVISNYRAANDDMILSYSNESTMN